MGSFRVSKFKASKKDKVSKNLKAKLKELGITYKQYKVQKLMEKIKKHGGCKAYKSALKLVDPSDKAKETMGIKNQGRISLKQYIYLVEELGFDGDKIKNWTKHRADKEINK